MRMRVRERVRIKMRVRVRLRVRTSVRVTVRVWARVRLTLGRLGVSGRYNYHRHINVSLTQIPKSTPLHQKRDIKQPQCKRQLLSP